MWITNHLPEHHKNEKSFILLTKKSFICSKIIMETITHVIFCLFLQFLYEIHVFCKFVNFYFCQYKQFNFNIILIKMLIITHNNLVLFSTICLYSSFVISLIFVHLDPIFASRHRDQAQIPFSGKKKSREKIKT